MDSEWVQISSDPFSRDTLVRKVTAPTASKTGCWECGNHRFRGKRRLEGLFVYATESPMGRVNVHKGEFCCKSCHDIYHS